jgi:spermidine synthase
MFNFLKPTVLLEERDSKFNTRVLVKKSWGLGTYLEVGGLTQSGGILNTIWRSTFRKINRKKLHVKSCLVIGLGGGSVVKWVKKYWPKVILTAIDIDPVMVELGQKYLKLGDYLVKVVIGDGLKFKKRGYDLVIIDTYIGDNYPPGFESEKFLKSLEKEKYVLFNRLYFGDKRAQAMKFGEKLKKHFKKVDYIYPEANLMFFCSNY